MQDWRLILGKNVRPLRQQKGLTREELAFKAEIDLTYMGGIERGRAKHSLLMVRIGKAVSVPLMKLLSMIKELCLVGIAAQRETRPPVSRYHASTLPQGKRFGFNPASIQSVPVFCGGKRRTITASSSRSQSPSEHRIAEFRTA
jgi:DNA-binding XRE family transcriptional regulator